MKGPYKSNTRTQMTRLARRAKHRQFLRARAQGRTTAYTRTSKEILQGANFTTTRAYPASIPPQRQKQLEETES